MLISSSRAGLLVYVVKTTYIFMVGLKLKYSLFIFFFILGTVLMFYFMVEWDGAYGLINGVLPRELEIGFEATVEKYSAFFLDDSVYERYTLWMSLMNMDAPDFARILTFGLGPGSFDNKMSQTIHNTPLDVLVSFGAISFISFGLVITRVIRRAASRSGRLFFLLGSVVLSIVLFSMFHDFGRTRFLWLFLGLAACCTYRNKSICSVNLYRSGAHENPPRCHRA
jgi:hypothetical protein